jgi:hypothetical protein
MKGYSALRRCPPPLLLLGAALIPVFAAWADEPSARFDGVWDTILSCPNSNGALGYAFEFDSLVKNGLLHAEKGKRDAPGYLRIDGQILSDGSADLFASGTVGASAMAVGQRPSGTPYAYHIAAKFSASSGSGQRVEGRPCTVRFKRK